MAQLISPPRRTPSSLSSGVGRVLVAAYGLLALAATGRSVFQIIDDFALAPIAYLFTALAAVVYIVATVALVVPGAAWYRVAWITIGFELLFVLTVGTLSIIDAELFPAKTVWSFYGRGYAFVPLVLPVLGMVWLWRRRPRAEAV
jgi:hypothetical protein